MLRDQTTRPRMKVAQTRFEPAPATDWTGVRTGGRAVCRGWHAHGSLCQLDDLAQFPERSGITSVCSFSSEHGRMQQRKRSHAAKKEAERVEQELYLLRAVCLTRAKPRAGSAAKRRPKE